MAVSVYLSAMGNEGFKKAAIQCMSKAHYMSEKLAEAGLETVNKGEFFHEFVTDSKTPASQILEKLESHDILGGYPLDDTRILWCCTEMNSKEDIDKACEIIREVL